MQYFFLANQCHSTAINQLNSSFMIENGKTGLLCADILFDSVKVHFLIVNNYETVLWCKQQCFCDYSTPAKNIVVVSDSIVLYF